MGGHARAVAAIVRRKGFMCLRRSRISRSCDGPLGFCGPGNLANVGGKRWRRSRTSDCNSPCTCLWHPPRFHRGIPHALVAPIAFGRGRVCRRFGNAVRHSSRKARTRPAALRSPAPLGRLSQRIGAMPPTHAVTVVRPERYDAAMSVAQAMQRHRRGIAKLGSGLKCVVEIGWVGRRPASGRRAHVSCPLVEA